jgi:hypothetical protein
VPQARDDARYFAPLSDLPAGPETELYFALVPYHPDDQPRAPPRPRSSTSTPRCGPRVGHLHRVRDGPRDRRGRPALLDLHREILAVQPA